MERAAAARASTGREIGYLLDSHWTPEIEGGLGEKPNPVTGAATEPGAPEADTDPEPVEVGPPED